MKVDQFRGGLFAAAGATVLAAASTFGDWLWANFIPDGAVLPGIVHGVLFFVLLSAVLASSVGTKTAWRRLLSLLPVGGLVLAASFYPIAMVLGYITGLLVTWAAMWLLLALALRWARAGRRAVTQALLRGCLAAIGSGFAFWAISGIWTNPATASDPLSLERFGAWTVAFFPGLLALLWGRAKPPAGSPNGAAYSATN